MCDRDRDLDDLLALNPSGSEIELAIKWTKPLDGNLHWEAHVDASAKRLRQKLLDSKGFSNE